ncbi:MAG: DUF4239 domain-containing protein [Chloroflexi bacterium]|nr:DUF4239 domain-containing protein [Chloroflexota bacterium]
MDTLLQFLVFIVGSVLLAVFGAARVRQRVPLEVQLEQNDVAGFFLAVLGLVYGVILAFAVIAVWEDLDDARRTAESEANAVGDLFRLAGGLPDESRVLLQEQALGYGHVVVNDEWPMLEHGNESAMATQLLTTLWSTVTAYEPKGPREETIYAKLLDKVNDIDDHRRERLVASRDGIPRMVWGVLIGGGVVTVLFTYFFGLKHRRALLAMTAMYVASIGFVLFLIAAMDHPFSGTVKVQPEAMEMVLHRIERSATVHR